MNYIDFFPTLKNELNSQLLSTGRMRPDDEIKEIIENTPALSKIVGILDISNGEVDIQTFGVGNTHHTTQTRRKAVLDFVRKIPLNRLRGIYDIQCLIVLGDHLQEPINLNQYTVLSFTKKLKQRFTLLPSPDIMTEWVGSNIKKVVEEDSKYHQKADKSLFIGSTTNVERITFCKWYDARYNRDNPDVNHQIEHTAKLIPVEDWCEARNWVIPEELITERIPSWRQLGRKINVHINGATWGWTRLFWQVASNCLPVHIPTDNDETVDFEYYFIPRDNYYVSDLLHFDSDCYYLLKSLDGKDVAYSILENNRKFYEKYLSERKLWEAALDITIYTLKEIQTAQQNG